MAIYSLNASILSRRKGHSSVGFCAKKSGIVLFDNQIGKKFDGSKNRKNIFNNLLIPDNSPLWIVDLKKSYACSVEKASSDLWNKIEKKENRSDSQLSRIYRIALPVELNQSENKKLIYKFIEKSFLPYNIVCDYTINFDEENPHTIIMTTMRFLENDGFGNKITELKTLKFLYFIRESWESYANESLKKNGFNIRIDRRSNKERGIELTSIKHFGKSVIEQEQRGIKTDRLKMQQKIQTENIVKILADPIILFNAVKSNSSTLSAEKIANTFLRHTIISLNAIKDKKSHDKKNLLNEITNFLNHEKNLLDELYVKKLLIDLEMNSQTNNFIEALKKLKPYMKYKMNNE